MAPKKSFHQSLNVHRQVFTRHENKDEKKVDTQKSENYWNFQKIFFFFSVKRISLTGTSDISHIKLMYLLKFDCTYTVVPISTERCGWWKEKLILLLLFEIFFLPCQFKIWVTILVGFFYLFNLIFETIMLKNISSLNLSFMYHLTLQVTYESVVFQTSFLSTFLCH